MSAIAQRGQVILHGVEVAQQSVVGERQMVYAQQPDKALHRRRAPGWPGVRFRNGSGGLRIEQGLKARSNARMVHRAKRMDASVGSGGEYNFGAIDSPREFRLRQHVSQQCLRHQRGVAGKHQSPLVFGAAWISGVLQRAKQTAQWPRALDRIGKSRYAGDLQGDIAYQRNVAADRIQHLAQMFRKVHRPVRSCVLQVPGQEGFRPPHPAAGSARQQEAQCHSNRMVALGLRGFSLGLHQFADKLEANNLLRICLVLCTVLVCFSYGSLAAGLPERPATATRKVTTVSVDPETGRLVRVVPGALPKSSKTPAAVAKSIARARETARQTPDVEPTEIRGMIDDTAKRHGIDPALVHSVIRVESNYQQKAISPKGAQGLMQLIPATAQRYGVANPFDPSQNLDGGVRYLKYLTERFDGDLRLALAAYNAGEGAVDRHQGIPPYQETQQYVTKVTRELTTRGVRVPAVPEDLRQATPETTLADTEPGQRRRSAPLRMFTDAEGRLHIETVTDE